MKSIPVLGCTLSILLAVGTGPLTGVAEGPRPQSDQKAAVETLRGDVVVLGSASSTDVVVLLATGGAAEPEAATAELAFVLQTDGHQRIPEFGKWSDATVSVHEAGLKIRDSSDRLVVALWLRDREEEVRTSLGVPGQGADHAAAGYGFSRRVGEWVIPGESRVAEFVASLGCGSADGIFGCTSGGRGATACSTPCQGGVGEPIRSCSVSCGANYYACCDAVDCSCTCV